MKKTKRWWNNWLVKGLAVLLPAHFLYAVLCKYVMPPITLTQVGAVLPSDVKFRREYVAGSQVSRNLYLALMAGEDGRYVRHQGFEWQAMWTAITHGTGGGSGISQQTAKNVFAWQHQDFLRKLVESYSTVVIERLWGKERILVVYVNVIEFEEGVYGAEAIAREIFGKPASELTRREAAMIAACVPQPKGCLRKRMDTPGVRKAQKKILKEMAYLETQEDVDRFLERLTGRRSY